MVINKIFLLLCFFFSLVLKGQELHHEHEGLFGKSKGLSGAGVAYSSTIEALRLNPALIGLYGSHYRFLGAYVLPENSYRPFYSVGITDSTSGPIAGGVSYTAFGAAYDESSSTQIPTKDRVHLGTSYDFGGVLFGVALQRLSYHKGASVVQTYLVNIGGIISLFDQDLTLGFSAENLKNGSRESPKAGLYQMYRIGLAYRLFNQNLALLIDYRQSQTKADGSFIRDVIGAGEWRVSQLITLRLGYGQGLQSSHTNKGRLSAGLSLLSDVMSLDYDVSSYPADRATKATHALSLSYILR